MINTLIFSSLFYYKIKKIFIKKEKKEKKERERSEKGERRAREKKRESGEREGERR